MKVFGREAENVKGLKMSRCGSAREKSRPEARREA